MTDVELEELKQKSECLNFSEPFTLDFGSGTVFSYSILNHTGNRVLSLRNLQSFYPE